MTTQQITYVQEGKDIERTEVKRKGKFLVFFDTEWWETVSEKTIGHSVHVKTTNKVDSVFVNGEEYTI
jgi:hypothetical protein